MKFEDCIKFNTVNPQYQKRTIIGSFSDTKETSNKQCHKQKVSSLELKGKNCNSDGKLVSGCIKVRKANNNFCEKKLPKTMYQKPYSY